MRSFVLVVGFLALVGGCGPRSVLPDGGVELVDAGTSALDAGGADAGDADAGALADAGEATHDAGDVDAGLADAGDLDAGADLDGGGDAGAFIDGGLDAGPRSALDGGHGRVHGECFRVPPELSQPTPSYLQVRLDFEMDQYDEPAERPRLTQGAQVMLATPNAGGSSAISEAFAFEVLALCEGATLVKTETQITYLPPTSKKTDILVSIDGQQVGVSVTRAVSFPPDAGYPLTPQRIAFLEGKLDDILVSSANVQPPDRWVKQLLVVMAQGDEHAATLRAAWQQIDAMSKADTVLYVVVTDGPDAPLY